MQNTKVDKVLGRSRSVCAHAQYTTVFYTQLSAVTIMNTDYTKSSHFNNTNKNNPGGQDSFFVFKLGFLSRTLLQCTDARHVVSLPASCRRWREEAAVEEGEDEGETGAMAEQ